MDSGYGCSEFFGVISVDKHEVIYEPVSEDVIDVGIPIPGAIVGVFDENGNELSYRQRGELFAKGPSIMHGYFNKPEQTKQMLDGEWLRTGDIVEIDENGYIYCYGRKKSSIEIEGKTVYLFDVSNALRHEFSLEDCMVEVKNIDGGVQSVVVYYVQKTDMLCEQKEICLKMNSYLKIFGITVDGYREFEDAFTISPTTLKPKTRYVDGFVNYSDTGDKISVYYSPTSKDDVWEIHKNA